MASSEEATSGTYSAKKEIEEYSEMPWVHEVAEKAAELINATRPLSENDVILDYGCGPGTTVKTLFSLIKNNKTIATSPSKSKSKSKSKPFDALLIDINKFMIEQADKVKWKEEYGRNVLSFTTGAFQSPAGAKPRFTKTFLDVLAMVDKDKPIDVCVMSLVMEYLTLSEVEMLALKLISKLSDGGVLALFEWAEHYSYPDEFKSSIPHMRGWSKEKFFQLAGRICNGIEKPERVLEEEKGVKKGMFPSQPEARVEARMGSFVCKQAHTQDQPSGDTVNYLIIQKRNT